MSKLSDYDIQALVDGELDPEKEAHILKILSCNPTALRRYKQLLRCKMLLRSWWDDQQKQKMYPKTHQ